jgi:hypothetical protein
MARPRAHVVAHRTKRGSRLSAAFFFASLCVRVRACVVRAVSGGAKSSSHGFFQPLLQQ